MPEWISETYKESVILGLALKQKLFSQTSPFQKVEVFASRHHGRVLMNDDCFMLCERDERIYHEMMAHVPLNVHQNARRVLIIGGGDGGTAREVLRYARVERVVLVEIDQVVVESCRAHIPSTANAFKDPRLELRIEDGVRFVREADETFDVILIDSTDPEGAAQPLFGAEFYADVIKRLAPGGIVIAQGESVFYESEMQRKMLEITSSHFQFTSPYNFTNMTYPGGLWSFMWASQTLHPLRDLKAPHSRTPDSNAPNSSLEMFYYNENVHRASFQLPEFQAAALKPWIKI